MLDDRVALAGEEARCRDPATGGAVCPKRSRVGSATSLLTTGTGPPAETRIGLFNANREIIVWVSVSGRTLAVYRDDVKGSNVTEACPASGQWTTGVVFTYGDGSIQE